MAEYKYKKKILIDLDGVLNQYGKEKFDENCIPEIKDGAKEFLENLLDEKTELYLFTTRNLLLASKWLIENEIDKYFKDVTNVKYLLFYILTTDVFVLTEIIQKQSKKYSLLKFVGDVNNYHKIDFSQPKSVHQ